MPRSVLSFFFLLCAALPALAQAPNPGAGELELEDGAQVKLALSRAISSVDAKTGDAVDFEVTDDIRINGILVIAKGAKAQGVIADAETKKTLGRGGKLDIAVKSVVLVDGEKVPLRGDKQAQGKNRSDVAKTGKAGIAILPTAPVTAFLHGKDTTLAKGTELIAYVDGGVLLNGANFTISAALESALPPAVLEIASTPAEAEVELDGKVAGSTPVHLTVLAGKHTLRISKGGYIPWQKEFQVSSEKISFAPELQPKDAETNKFE